MSAGSFRYENLQGDVQVGSGWRGLNCDRRRMIVSGYSQWPYVRWRDSSGKADGRRRWRR